MGFATFERLPRSRPTDVSSRTTSQSRFFVSPEPAGRKITAGYSYLQRISKNANVDVWFPRDVQQTLNDIVVKGEILKPELFPAEWAAIRQFELLQESGNYKIYDLEVTHLTRSLLDFSRNMRAGGYRVIVVTIGRYEREHDKDDLAILDQRLQERISTLTHMFYLEEESAAINREMDDKLAHNLWDYRTALPHIGVALGAQDLLRPTSSSTILSSREKKDRLSRHFFDIVGLLPQNHVVHDTAIGLQLPEANAENENIYLAQAEHSVRSFNQMLVDLFSPFDNKVNLSSLQGRSDAASEIKATVQHMRGYGDRLRPDDDRYIRNLSRLMLQ